MQTTSDGFQLYTKNYLLANPNANLLLVHGMGEHCERYTHVAAALNTLGISVYSFDLRGHGKSTGDRVFIKDIAEYREDVETIYKTVPKDLPLFILGHSMGGLITLNFLLHQVRTEIKGVVLSGAALAVGDDITPVTQFVLKLVGNFLPQLKTLKLDPKSISRDEKIVEEYQTDPLIYHEGAKAGTGLALLKAIKEITPKFKDFNYPALFMHGEADKIVNPQGTKDLFAECKSTDKTLKIWDNAYHEIFNEINKNEVIDLMVKWIADRI